MSEAAETDQAGENYGGRYANVAPTWHTLVVLASLGLLSAMGVYTQATARVPHARLVTYGVTIVVEWSLVSFLRVGLKGHGLRFRDLIGGSWSEWLAPLNDLGIALAFLIVANLMLASIAPVVLSAPRNFLRNLAPHGKFEVAAFLLLSLTAGFCEELIFRGYLQRQFTAWTQSASAGLSLQAIVFGGAHGYQGLRLMAVIGVYGCLLGILALLRESLRPGMMAHFLQDAIRGLTWMR